MEDQALVGNFKSDEKYRRRMLGILVTIIALNISQTCVLPSLSSYLATFHANTPTLGYCLAAVCLGEFFTAKIWEPLLQVGPRDPTIIALVINAAAMLIYGIAPNIFVLMGSRFLVGCASGVQWGLLDLACSMTDLRSRAPLLVSLRFGAHTVAFIVGMGIAAVASFQHTSPKGGLGDIHHDLPSLVDPPSGSGVANSTASMGSMASFTLGSMEISPNSRRLLEAWGTKGKKAVVVHALTPAHSPGYLAAVARGIKGEGKGKPSNASEGSKEAVKGQGKGMGANEAPRGARAGPKGTADSTRGDMSDDMRTANRALTKDIANGLKAATITADRVKDDMHSVTRETSQELGIGTIRVHDVDPIPTETDDQISHKVGGHMYMPTYITAVVGHGMAAPAYASVLISVCSAVIAFNTLGGIEPFRVSALQLPPSAVGSRGIRMLMPLSGLAVLEFLAQMCSAATDTLVAPTTQVYFGWTLDASAVFMLGMCASGIVGLAISEVVRPRAGVRRVLIACTCTISLSFAICIPWGGTLTVWQYCLGCFTMSFAAAPMSAFAVRVFTAGAVKTHGDDLEAGWMVLIWQLTGFPTRIAAPIIISYAMELNQGASPNYIGLLLCSLACLVFFLNSQRPSEAAWGGPEREGYDAGTPVMGAGGASSGGERDGVRGQSLRGPLSGDGNYGSFKSGVWASP